MASSDSESFVLCLHAIEQLKACVFFWVRETSKLLNCCKIHGAAISVADGRHVLSFLRGMRGMATMSRVDMFAISWAAHNKRVAPVILDCGQRMEPTVIDARGNDSLWFCCCRLLLMTTTENSTCRRILMTVTFWCRDGGKCPDQTAPMKLPRHRFFISERNPGQRTRHVGSDNL